VENEEGRIRVDSSGKRQWWNRWQQDGEIMTKVADRDRLRGSSRKIYVRGGPGDDKDAEMQQPSKVQQTKRPGRSATAGTGHTVCDAWEYIWQSGGNIGIRYVHNGADGKQ
jgi:hypothetical protein